jgi:hypothetical protein
MFETPELNPEQWGLGECLGSGLDKVAYDAVFIGPDGQAEPTNLVLKHQRLEADPDYREGQTRLELAAQNYLLKHATEDWAKAALPWLAHIVGWYEDGTDLWILQEKVDTSDYCPEIWNTPIAYLPDQGGCNAGRHPFTNQLVSCDYGLAKAHNVEHLGDAALRYAKEGRC